MRNGNDWKPNYEKYNIPQNFQNGMNLLGYHFDTRNFFEGIGIGTILGIIVLLILMPMPIDIGTKIGIILGFVILGILIGCKGINDEPVTAFVNNYLTFKKRRRTAIFNNDIKLDKSYSQKKKEQEDKSFTAFLNSIFGVFSTNIEKRKQIRAIKERVDDYLDADTLYFKDDEGYKEKPKEYMTDAELKDEIKKEKQHQKKIRKMAKEIEMERRYKDGK